MSIALALLAIAHGLAMIAVLAASHYSQVLIDDDGRPLSVSWREATIPEGARPRVAEESSRQA